MAKGTGGKGGVKGVGGAGGRAAATARAAASAPVGGGGATGPTRVTDASSTAAINSAVHQAGRSLAGSSGRIVLADLRDAMPKLSPTAFDKHMKRLQVEGKLVMMRDDSPPYSRPERVERGAVDIAGAKRHFVHFEHDWRGD